MMWGSASPTDVDVFLEFNNQLFVFGEIKGKHGRFAGGQERALVNLAKSMSKPSVYMHLRHEQEDKEDILLKETWVESMLVEGEWEDVGAPFPLVMDALVKRFKLPKRYKRSTA